MKQILSILIVTILIAACNQSGGNKTTADSLGTKAIDTFGRNDTMYYERMQNKTNAGPTDSGTQKSVRNDTMQYERLQHKTSTRDTSN